MSAFTVFTNKLHSCLSASEDPYECAEHVATHLSELLKTPEFLEEVYREGCPDEPKANLVYVSPKGLFSVVAFVWQPGQATCIHDHVCWCVVGVLEGQEEETAFRIMTDGEGEKWLEPTQKINITPGHVCKLVPPGEDIHQVRNAGTETAISIHVYGTDIGKRGTSINRRFDNLPVKSGLEGTPLNWRDLDLGADTGIHLS